MTRNVLKGVSLIICTYNGKSRLEPTLSSVIRQNVSPGLAWELLIIDNSSNDGTAEYCKEFLERSCQGIAWRVIGEPVPGLSHARRNGVLNALYEYVVFCDDDNWLNLDFVQLVYGIMEESPEIGVLGGAGIPVLQIAKPEWFDAYSKSYAVGLQDPASGVIYGAGMAIRKSVLVDLYSKGFASFLLDRRGNDLVSGGDNEICLWYQYLGYKIYFDQRLKFKHFVPASRLTMEYLLRRATGKGKTEALLAIYASIFGGEEEVKWLNNRLLWYVELIKRFLLWANFCTRPSTFEGKLKRNFLLSSIRFRLANYRYLKTCEIKLKMHVDTLNKMTDAS